MKKIGLLSVLFSVSLLSAQTNTDPKGQEKHQPTIHVKKVENLNGVEKITDTTFNISDITIVGDNPELMEVLTKDGLDIRIVELSYEGERKLNDAQGKSPEEIDQIPLEHLMKEMKSSNEKDSKGKGIKKVVTINEESVNTTEGKTENKVTKIIMIKMNVIDACQEDKKRLSNQIGSTNDKLETGNMTMAPNPSDGKFNLNVSLKNKGDAEVTIFNIEGRQIYSEKLPNFSGEYNKSIEIGGNQKGVYFVKILQGKDSQVKKVLLE
jgi:hypothetical protein